MAAASRSNRGLFHAVLLSLILWPGTTFSQSERSQGELQELLKVKIRTVQHMALNPILIRAARAQNSQGLSMQVITQRDDQWRATKELTPLKIELQGNAAGRFLRENVRRLEAINEAFLTDAQGANVAAFPPTSDYWQGDEDKWSESFNEGDGRIHVGAIELDESTQAYAAQISAPVFDRGRTIGVLVVGVTVNYLEEREK